MHDIGYERGNSTTNLCSVFCTLSQTAEGCSTDAYHAIHVFSRYTVDIADVAAMVPTFLKLTGQSRSAVQLLPPPSDRNNPLTAVEVARTAEVSCFLPLICCCVISAAEAAHGLATLCGYMTGACWQPIKTRTTLPCKSHSSNGYVQRPY